MKQYSAPQVKDIVLQTEYVMQDSSFQIGKGEGSTTGSGQSTNEKGLGVDIWKDNEE